MLRGKSSRLVVQCGIGPDLPPDRCGRCAVPSAQCGVRCCDPLYTLASLCGVDLYIRSVVMYRLLSQLLYVASSSTPVAHDRDKARFKTIWLGIVDSDAPESPLEFPAILKFWI